MKVPLNSSAGMLVGLLMLFKVFILHLHGWSYIRGRKDIQHSEPLWKDILKHNGLYNIGE